MKWKRIKDPLSDAIHYVSDNGQWKLQRTTYHPTRGYGYDLPSNKTWWGLYERDEEKGAAPNYWVFLRSYDSKQKAAEMAKQFQQRKEEYSSMNEGKRNLKSGEFKSSAIGNKVKVRSPVIYDSEREGEFAGKTGTIVKAYREPTFSQMKPWIVQYKVEFDDGGYGRIRKENLQTLREESKLSVNTVKEAYRKYKKTGKVSVLSEKID